MQSSATLSSSSTFFDLGLDENKIKLLFCKYDKKGKKRLTAQDFRYICHNDLKITNSTRMDALINGIFIAGDGEGGAMNFSDQKLNLDEFTNIMKHFPPRINKKDEDKQLNHILFSLVDTDGSGTIEFKELNRFLQKFGVCFTRIGSYSKFKKYDTDGNGHIDEDEFYNLFFDITSIRN